MSYFDYFDYLTRFVVDAAWLESVGPRILFELDPKKPVLYVVPVESIQVLGKLQVVPVGDFGTVPYGMRAHFPGAVADRAPGSGDGYTKNMQSLRQDPETANQRLRNH